MTCSSKIFNLMKNVMLASYIIQSSIIDCMCIKEKRFNSNPIIRLIKKIHKYEQVCYKLKIYTNIWISEDHRTIFFL